MTSTPPPSEATTSGSTRSLDAMWRDTVLQSYRNGEAREIAKTLAELEPGTSTSSKLSLALRFEDTVFQAATSLEDYRKKLAKRLKKLKKNYKPVPKAAGQSTTSKEQLFNELKQKHGESLLFIYKNASKAVQDVLSRHGQTKATQLQQHTDSAKAWAKDLGLLEDPPATKTDHSEAHLQRLEHHLEKRVGNIRQYVVKHADPDLFLQETLERKDNELPQRAADIMSTNLTKRMQQLAAARSGDSATTAGDLQGIALLQEAMEKAQVPVPPPTRNNSNHIPAAMLHIDKMRAASTALLTYITMKDRKTTAPRQTLRKTHTIVKEGTAFIQELAKKRGLNDTTKDDTPKLQDAWIKVLELPTENKVLELPTDDASAAIASPSSSNDTTPAPTPPPTKKRKLSIATKTKVLFRPKRRTPTNLIPALERKRAILVRPEPDGHGSHLVLHFETFKMTIYFNPLLVTLRATEDNEFKGFHTIPKTGCASWTPLHFGLANRKDLSVWGVDNKSYQSVGPVVEERLRDASTQATNVLRTCFGNHVKDKTQEIEVEILEGSALLEFVQIARTTYMPNWQDDDNVKY
jgi:hypothetical protein